MASATAKVALTNAAWTDITPSTHTTLIVHALGDVVIYIGSANNPALTVPGIFVRADEKIDLSGRMGASDFVIAKSVRDAASIITISV